VDGAHGRVTTLYDDAADVLTGSAGQDSFVFNADGENGTRKDKVTDLSAAEFASDLDFVNGP
jgi:Ca2+-binding RTX toxin-like protein